MRNIYFIVDRSRISKDEIDVMLSNGSYAELEGVFYVVAEAFTPSELGISSNIKESNPSLSPAVSLSPSLPQMSVEVMPGIALEDPFHPDRAQRITWKYKIIFTGIGCFTADMRELELTASFLEVSASASIYLFQQPHPYSIDGAVSWLSTDLRIFQIKESQFRFNKVMRSDPNEFIADVLTNLNNGTTGGETFENISTDPMSSRLELSQTVDGVPVYNFAIARVRYRSSCVSAQNVKVFFRMFTSLSTTMEYDQATAYRRATQGSVVKPLPGIIDGEVVTVPFFAASRIDSSSRQLAAQNDQPNTKLIPSNFAGNELVRYFGCWLDINQPQSQFPLNPVPPDGPYPSSARKSIQELIRSHQPCLVAEIVFDPETILSGATPARSDRLIQRNLAVVESGPSDSHAAESVVFTFEFRPTRKHVESDTLPDELMIEWGNFPAGCMVTLELPDIDSGEILRIAGKYSLSNSLKSNNEHTLEFRSGGTTYIPIPYREGANYPGLISVVLPDTVRKGQSFSIVIRQITNDGKDDGTSSTNADIAGEKFSVGRSVLGTFQVFVPVNGKEDLLDREERLLSNLRWIEKTIPSGSRWYSVFRKYVQQIVIRVDVFGGNSEKIFASPDGQWQKAYLQFHIFGTAAVLLLSALLVFAGCLTGITHAVIFVLSAFLFAGVLRFWLQRYRPGNSHLFLLPVIAGVIGASVLAVLFFMAVKTPQLVAVLFLCLFIAGIAAVIAIKNGYFHFGKSRTTP